MAVLVGVAVLVAVVFLWRPWVETPKATELLARAELALESGEYDRAVTLATRVPRGEVWPRAQLVAGEAATRAGRLEEAIGYYSSVPRDGAQEAVLAVLSLGEVCRETGHLTEALSAYRYVLEHQPDNAAVHTRVAFLLGVMGRRWESLPHFMALVRNREWDLDSLALLGDLERPMEQGEYVRRCFENSPDDVLVQLAMAAHNVAEGHSSEARRLLQQVIAADPGIIAAQAMVGELIVDADSGTFLRWHAALPPDAERHPDIWYVRGLWARRQGELPVAARCFWEAVRLAPTHRRGTYNLGQVLVSLGEDSGEAFAARASQFSELTNALDLILRSRGRNATAMRRAAELTEAMGRLWESAAWCTTAASTLPSAPWTDAALERLLPQLDEDTPQVLPSANLSLQHDLSHLPHPRTLLRQAPSDEGSDGVPHVATIRFTERSQAAGLNFVYDNSADPATRGARQFEQTGGGVAVLDFDSDSRPDLYFTQGAAWPTGARQPVPSADRPNRIYRNMGVAGFIDVTREARLGDTGFGQGPAIGDFNNDGFPDVYVANIGLNRLYQNNGDGTFSDITETCGLTGDDWTASCAIADLNADGRPDLFDVNYLVGSRLYEMICDGRACSPKMFDGAADRLFINRGDGTFVFAAAAPASAESGKGLGLVVANLTDSNRPSIFIANDQVPNFLLRNEPAENAHNIRLEDAAFVSGVAFNEDGLPMACMGVAADDADGNGLLDLFVTNFQDEANTLYLQDSPGLFVDATNAAGLRAPSWPYVGWGTQFLDADLDGEPDLVLTNGHIDDYRDEGRGFHMRPQFFRNLGSGRFVELMADQVGPWFAGEYLGRGLARLDWNTDGKMDFVVSNVGDRASLVANESADVGRFLNVRVQGTTGARDAIGAVVEVAAGDRRWTKQLVAGDGYMASNERILQFGLGEVERVTELQVRWPSGGTTTLQDLPADATIQLVEGAPRAIVWRGNESRLIDTR